MSNNLNVFWNKKPNGSNRILNIDQDYLSWDLLKKIVLLQSYLIKMITITTNTIVTITPLIPPTIGPILLV